MEGQYNELVTTLDALQTTDVTGSEGRPADGILQLKTSFEQDKAVQNVGLQSFKNNNPFYNGATCNCSDFAREGIMWATPLKRLLDYLKLQ